MSSETDTPCRRIPSLVYYCRRVAAAHVDGIVSLGDTVSYDLVRPILETCSVDNLRRLEDATPHLRGYTNELWRQQCYREHLAEAEECSSRSLVPSEPWRDIFFDLRAKKEKRLQEISARMKSQRLEAEERKKQKEIKFTDRLPPMKRTRGWTSTPQQKSLFQKTRSEASKIQRTMFEPCMRPPMPAAHANRQRVRNVVPESPSTSQPTSGSRVIVRPVVYRQSPTVLPASPVTETKAPTLVQNASFERRGIQTQPLESAPRVKQPSLGAKKEPTCPLFMPKHRAHSQLTGRLVPSRAFPTE
ncbi:RNA polymerase II transcription factor SIII subunit A-domain-containing protein [Russula earlei]|uniref:RNA polymerase II transcription factor SIII subunit A-domain-containing protein n=1 Tax=Russula earlei TaxID=71964 RepID=A0ACC0U1M5_9AGAM|nr:RNA polymerase II transcription factor SIII subunit A-domain-containing protein [Russula earlei]